MQSPLRSHHDDDSTYFVDPSHLASFVSPSFAHLASYLALPFAAPSRHPSDTLQGSWSHSHGSLTEHIHCLFVISACCLRPHHPFTHIRACSRTEVIAYYTVSIRLKASTWSTRLIENTVFVSRDRGLRAGCGFACNFDTRLQ